MKREATPFSPSMDQFDDFANNNLFRGLFFPIAPEDRHLVCVHKPGSDETELFLNMCLGEFHGRYRAFLNPDMDPRWRMVGNLALLGVVGYGESPLMAQVDLLQKASDAGFELDIRQAFHLSSSHRSF